MIARIQKALEKCGISLWRVNETVEETAELFFVKKQLDTRRVKDVRKYEVTVFRDVEDTGGGRPRRGFTAARLVSSMDDGQIEEELRGAYYAAQFAANPYYELPDPVKAPMVEKTGPLAEAPLAESAGKMVKALFAPDVHEDAFLNSAEVFVHRKLLRILSSEGADVSYTDACVKGEFVVQCREPEDVEIHNTFFYDDLNGEALSGKVTEALAFVRDRARARRVLKSGKYDLVLSGNQVAEVLSYYQSRSSASAVYAKYSTWQQGEDVQGADVTGERLDVTLRAVVPYSEEGIPMKDMSLLEAGKLQAYHGPNRFCRYLGVKPTGFYGKLACANGTLPFAEMKKKPCLWAVTFSDFQMDAMSGHFGGEIRLAYLIDGDTVTPVTGGSVNGSVLEAQKAFTFSTDRYVTASYDGPYAMRILDVSIAGAS
ncbi:MAG: hypothetical protein K2P04_07375 [Oscillospiraceae bacterium]|jgi:predicted Zn-dependent protease|nr:hypothetical protein [Oscillospiraceae bacterium]MDE6997677.1 hypothetical protein [Oscillospiraceae bacterium]